jgi:hypothetical protein
MDTKVLINWTPSEFETTTIEREFNEIVQSLLGTLEVYPDIEVRNPAYYKKEDLTKVLKYHQDGIDTAERFGYIKHSIVWSNIFPTEILLVNGEKLKTKDGDIVLINNIKDEHKIPRAAIGSNRWFVRMNNVYKNR